MFNTILDLVNDYKIDKALDFSNREEKSLFGMVYFF
jgi:hypothetical protein